MITRIGAATLGCLFIFILITTVWDYCPPAGEAGRPDPDKLLSKRDSMISGPQIEKEHHPCASLKDVYDVSPALGISGEKGTVSAQYPGSGLSTGVFKRHDAVFHGLSPPDCGHFLNEFPLFLRYNNLRI